MAKKPPKRKGLTREQLWKIWAQIRPESWLEIVRSFKPHLGFTYASQGVLKGLCPNPDHADTTPSFFANVSKGYCKCFGCDMYLTDPVAFVAMIMDVAPSDAMQYLQENFKFPFLSKKALKELEAQQTNQEAKRAIYNVSHDYMINAVTSPAKHPAAQEAVDWLTQVRQIDPGILPMLPIGIFPPLADLQTMLSNQYLQALKAWKSNEQQGNEPINLTEPVTNYLAETVKSSKFNGAVLFPLHATPKEIGRLKFRVPSNTKDFNIPDDEYEDLLGLFGLGWSGYQDFTDPANKITHAYLTEGEMDVLSLMARMAKSGNIDIPLYSAGGSGGAAHIEPIMKVSGIDTAYLIGDSPQKGPAGGDKVVQEWLRHMPDTHTRVFTGWDALQPAGDLDEAVINLGEAQVLDVLHKRANQNFVPVWKWAFERASLEVDALDEDDKRKRHECAAQHGKYLRNKKDCDIYVDAIAQAFELNERIIKREIVSTEDSEQGFILRCTDALREIMTVVGTRVRGSYIYLVCYNKENGRYHQFRLDDERSIAQELATVVGSVYEFVNQYVGFPSFFTLPDDTDGHEMPTLDRLLRYYVRDAIAALAPGAPDYETSPHLRQGYHRTKLRGGAHVEYVVSGADIFAVDREESALKYRKLNGPSDRGLIFDVGLEDNHRDESWYPGGLTTQSLERGRTVDAGELFKTSEEYYDIGFQFRNHKTMKTFCASLPFIFSVMDAFPKPLMLFVSGETSSGKSKFVSSFTGQDTTMRDLRLFYASQNLGSYTEAGIASAANNDRRLMGLDEFESDEGTRKSAAVVNIFELYRPMINGEVVRARGTKGGSHYIAHLRHPVIFSAIITAQKPQDFNRVIHIEMEHVDNRPSPERVLLGRFGKTALGNVARDIAVCMYPHVPQLIENYEHIAEEFYRRINTTLPQKVEERWASHLFPTLAFLKLLGRDWEAFFREFVIQNTRETTLITDMPISESLFRDLTQHRIFEIERDQPKRSIISLLSTGNEAAYINDCSYGVFYDEKKKVLVFLMDTMDEVVGRRFRQYAPAQLKAILRRHPQVLSDRSLKESGVLQKSVPYFGAHTEPRHVVALDVSTEVSSARQRAAEDSKKAQAAGPTAVKDEEDAETKDASNFDWSDRT